MDLDGDKNCKIVQRKVFLNSKIDSYLSITYLHIYYMIFHKWRDIIGFVKVQ